MPALWDRLSQDCSRLPSADVRRGASAYGICFDRLLTESGRSTLLHVLRRLSVPCYCTAERAMLLGVDRKVGVFLKRRTPKGVSRTPNFQSSASPQKKFGLWSHCMQYRRCAGSLSVTRYLPGSSPGVLIPGMAQMSRRSAPSSDPKTPSSARRRVGNEASFELWRLQTMYYLSHFINFAFL